MEEIGKMKGEAEVWKIINRGRKIWKEVNEEINIEEWKRHFMEILGGEEGKGGIREIGDGGGRKGRAEEGIENLKFEEVEKMIKGLKKDKAVGGDNIQNEIWKKGGREIRESMQ